MKENILKRCEIEFIGAYKGDQNKYQGSTKNKVLQFYYWWLAPTCIYFLAENLYTVIERLTLIEIAGCQKSHSSPQINGDTLFSFYLP